jgi:hypothetical protein
MQCAWQAVQSDCDAAWVFGSMGGGPGATAKGQAGFRDGKGTNFLNSHVFVLKHSVDRCQKSYRVYLCFTNTHVL